MKKPKGLGDVVETAAKVTGAKYIIEKINGGSCKSCQNRKEGWNLKYPFN